MERTSSKRRLPETTTKMVVAESGEESSSASCGMSSPVSPNSRPRKMIRRLVSSDLTQTDLARAMARRDHRESVPTAMHPHHALLNMLRRMWGYQLASPSWRFDELPEGFMEPPPTPEQVQGYTTDLLLAVRSGDVQQLREILLTPQEDGRQRLNCANAYGERLLHLAARKQSLDVLRFLLEEAKVPVRVHDDFGRTPLHDACWTDPPNLAVVDLIVKHCPDLLYVEDKRGHTPLFYARREHWKLWIVHLCRHAMKHNNNKNNNKNNMSAESSNAAVEPEEQTVAMIVPRLLPCHRVEKDAALSSWLATRRQQPQQQQQAKQLQQLHPQQQPPRQPPPLPSAAATVAAAEAASPQRQPK